MSRAPKQESIPLSAAISPYGVIDFRSNVDAHSELAAAIAMQQNTVAPGSVVGGPPAYLEAHGIRYVPSIDPHLGSDISDGPGNSLFVPMSDPDRDGSSPLDSSASPSGGAYVSPHELNSRVDERIRRFMELQAPSAAAFAAHPATSTGDRLRALRRDCEVAAQSSASAGKPIAAAAGDNEASARSRKDPARAQYQPNHHHHKMSSQAPAVISYGSRGGGRRGEQYYYDF
jgi:hypothetical protein